MHTAAYNWVEWCVRVLPPRRAVLEIGSRDVNGSVRPLFPRVARYWGIDTADGPGVDEVADGATWRSPGGYDTVVCCECLEHVRAAPDICTSAWTALAPGGVFIVTAAGRGRPPHSAVDGGPLRPGEWYGNVGPDELRTWLTGFSVVLVDAHTIPTDVYALAVK